MNRRLASLLIVLLVASNAQAASLDDLFVNGRYEQFFPRAKEAAAAGDGEALFLLGKAYHLGKGVAPDVAVAHRYYQAARERGSARASHNLGSMARQAGKPAEAIPLFEEALERGLKMPTLYNLALAHSPAEPTNYFNLRDAANAAGVAGDYFAQAYEAEPDVSILFEASREYLRAWMYADHLGNPEASGFDIAALRERALEWLRRGTEQDFGPSWTNYGILLRQERDYAGARAALELGAAKGTAAAHYHLAEMARAGQGLDVARDVALALQHYEKAVLLGLEAARRPARELLAETLKWETDLHKLEDGIRRFDALRGNGEDYEEEEASSYRRRAIWGRLLEARRRVASPLPGQPLHLRACGLDLGQPHGDTFNLGVNSSWRLAAYSSLERPQLFSIEGRVDTEGCAVWPSALPEPVRSALSGGAVLALQFPNYSLPLRHVETPTAVVLEMQADVTPIPDY